MGVKKPHLRKEFMKKIGIILAILLLTTGLVLMSCASSGGGASAGGAAPRASSSAPATVEVITEGTDPTTIKFRHFLGIYVQENWNATSSNEAVLSNILEHTYSFMSGRQTAGYLDYFILEKRESGNVQSLKIKAITITADGEAIPLDLQNLADKPAWSAAPVVPTKYDNGVLIVNYPRRFEVPDYMPRLPVVIPEAKKATIAGAKTVSVKIELAD
jgi:hypothetical protein